jgi:diacylglycerol kinase (ATP)
MSRRLVLLANPTAGRGRAARLIPTVLDRLRADGTEVDLVTGSSAAEAQDLARAAVALSRDGLVALGGDGLVNLAAQVAVESGTPLGIVPAGTGNDAARALGVPLGNPVAAAELVVRNGTRAVDVGRVDGRVFLAVVSSGFDSKVNERANRMTWPRGPVRYKLAMLAELRVFRAVPYEVVLDGELLTTSAMLVAVGNGPSYGGGMRVCPGADLTDGLLDVTILTPLATARFLRMFPTVYTGEHVKDPAVLTRRARTVELRAAGMTAYADGEPVGPLPVTVEAVPGGLTVFG